MTFQNAPRWSLGTRLRCHIAAIGEKKSPGVSAPIDGGNRLRFSLAIKFTAIGVDRGELKIARCVAGLKAARVTNVHACEATFFGIETPLVGITL